MPLALPAAEPPPDLLKRVLERETQTEAVRGNYAYRQKVLVEELEVRGRKRGEYREARDVVFTPEGQRHEQMVGKPVSTLDRLRLTGKTSATCAKCSRSCSRASN
jgi:hypothetical protein